ncbi:acyl carrier protein [Nocardia tenerifensis]|uniref:Acyl carrier protein n=2 Tax=Nocardia tenerifensis TaxID=228006 RepID=A0A318JUE5_9NOCA|nr:phosphopantetheine-binding protein [Nocardia tenerifensis]PXX55552.1 acyl carrier protein [Nocardia tenerifensis]
MTEITEATIESVAAALGLDDDEVTVESTLIDELGAESIDLLDILFRIERKTGVKVQAADIGDAIQGGIPDDEFGDENEIVSAQGLAQLARVMPQIDVEALAGKLQADQIMSLLTVQNLIDIVVGKAKQASDAA